MGPGGAGQHRRGPGQMPSFQPTSGGTWECSGTAALLQPTEVSLEGTEFRRKGVQVPSTLGLSRDCLGDILFS